MKASTLEELIDQQISLGHKDPHQIPELLEKQLGEELLLIVRPYLADFISEMARQRMNNARRRDVVNINATNADKRETLLHSLWVPDDGAGITYKRIADMTAEDFDARGQYLERMASGIATHARWCREVADMIRRHGVQSAGQLPRLPQLHEADE